MSDERFVISVADLRDYMVGDGFWRSQFLCYAVDAYAGADGIVSLGDYESVVVSTMSGWFERELVSTSSGIEECFTAAELDGFLRRVTELCGSEFGDSKIVEHTGYGLHMRCWRTLVRIGMLCEVLERDPDAEFVFVVEQ